MTPTVKGANFHGQDALRIEQGGLVAILLPRLGGRVISLVVDGVDLFWHDPRLAGPPEALAAIPRPVWWGGWKTWVAPQSRWKGGAPQRDLDEGAWRHEIPTDPATGHWFVRMTSPVDRETGLEIVREVAMIPESSALRARVTFTNRGAPGPLEAGIWEVLQLKKPAQVTVPVDRGHFADEQGVRTYATECDSRAARPKHVRTREDAAGRRAEIRCSGDLRFKFGARTPANYGRIRAVMPERGRRALKLQFAAPPGAAYAHEANAEVYNSDEADYCEIEAHAPLATLAPGASVTAEFTLEVKGPG